MTPIFYTCACRTLNRHGEAVCGCKAEQRDTQGGLVAVLASGQGAGIRAGAPAAMACRMLLSMEAQGEASWQAAQVLAEAQQAARRPGVAFSLLRLWPDGSARLAEYRQPPAILLRKGRPMPLEEEKMPLEGLRLAAFSCRPGDWYCLCSAGFFEAAKNCSPPVPFGRGEITQYLSVIRARATSQSAADCLINAAFTISGEHPPADCAVAVVRAGTAPAVE